MNQSQNRFAIIVIVALGLALNIKYINEFPSYIHAWAQSDRYALAIGFTDNGLNFFKPESLIYSHQFPNNWTVPTDRTETAVDFPIHEFVPAVIMKIFGEHSPWIFRTYIFLYSFLGLYYLFKLAYLITGDFYRSLFVVIFGLTSPVFVYYQGGFLPTIPSLSNAIIGIYFYEIYRRDRHQGEFTLSILFLTLASLSRLTFAIALIAVLILEFLTFLRKGRTYKKSKLAVIIGSIVLLSGNFLYTASLRDRYGSDFLSQPLPARSITEAIDLVKVSFQNWGTQYFSLYHYVIFILLLLITLFFRIRKGKGIILDILKIKRLGVLVILMFTGSILFSILMLRQFPAHDYYFLDTFFLPIMLLIILLLAFLPRSLESKRFQLFSFISLFLLCIPMVLIAGKSQTNRRNIELWDRSSKMISSFEGAGDFLDSVGIDQNARILVLDAIIPNAPFILMERKGYPVMSTTRENILNSLTWNFDYIVIQNDYFISDIYSVYPDIINRIDKVADNRKISLFKLSEDPAQNQSLSVFWELDKKDPIFKEVMNYDSAQIIPRWKNIESTTDTAFSGSNGGVINAGTEFGLTFSLSGMEELTRKPPTLFISSYFLARRLKDLILVVDLSMDGVKSYYRTVNIENLLNQNGQWEQADFLFQLPIIEHDDSQLNIFFWNKGNNQLYLDDFTISIYE